MAAGHLFHPDGCGVNFPSKLFHPDGCGSYLPPGWLWVISCHPDGCGLVSIDSAWQIPQRLSVGHLRAYYHTRNGIDIGRSLSRNSLSFFYNILHARSNLSIVIKEDKVFRSIGEAAVGGSFPGGRINSLPALHIRRL